MLGLLVAKFVGAAFVSLMRLAEVVDVDVPQTAPLCLNAPIHRVVCVTGVACFVGGHPVILEMRCGKIRRIVHVEALSVGLHDVARQAEFRTLRSLKLIGNAHGPAQNGQAEENEKRQDFATARHGRARPHK